MKRILAMFAVGALPLAGLAITSHFLPTAGDSVTLRIGVCTGLGALWGFAAGVLRRSLIRAIVGLNIGALCGYLFSYALRETSVHESTAILLLIAVGAALGGALNLRRDNISTLFKGMAAGTLAFGFMGCASWFVSNQFTNNLLGWTVMCLIPFGGGMAIFIGLVGREPQGHSASVATAPSAARLSEYDNERGRATQSTTSPISSATSDA